MENNFVAIMSFLSQVFCPVRWSLLCMAWWTQQEPPKSITRARAYIHLCQRVTAHSSRRSADRQFVNNSKWLLIFEAEQHGGWKSHQMDSFHPPSSFLLLPLPLMERRSRVRYEEKEESRGRGGGVLSRKVRTEIWACDGAGVVTWREEGRHHRQRNCLTRLSVVSRSERLTLKSALLVCGYTALIGVKALSR